MWYEILPSFGIIVFAMAAPQAITYVANKLVIGNHYRRSIVNQKEALQYFRDTRIAGNPYKITGLENIPDA